jgi:rubrerythrin
MSRRLIDVDAAIGGVKNRCLGQNDVVKVEHSIISMLYMMPTIDAEPVRHAKLLNAHPYGECSNCGYLIDIREEFNYCPNCGCRMDKDE